jgi:hypothetical protein
LMDFISSIGQPARWPHCSSNESLNTNRTASSEAAIDQTGHR